MGDQEQSKELQQQVSDAHTNDSKSEEVAAAGQTERHNRRSNRSVRNPLLVKRERISRHFMNAAFATYRKARW